MFGMSTKSWIQIDGLDVSKVGPTVWKIQIYQKIPLLRSESNSEVMIDLKLVHIQLCKDGHIFWIIHSGWWKLKYCVYCVLCMSDPDHFCHNNAGVSEMQSLQLLFHTDNLNQILLLIFAHMMKMFYIIWVCYFIHCHFSYEYCSQLFGCYKPCAPIMIEMADGFWINCSFHFICFALSSFCIACSKLSLNVSTSQLTEGGFEILILPTMLSRPAYLEEN